MIRGVRALLSDDTSWGKHYVHFTILAAQHIHWPSPALTWVFMVAKGFRTPPDGEWGVLYCESSITGSCIPACVHLRVCLCVQINDYWRKKCHRLVFYTNNLELCDGVRKCPRGGNMTFVVLCYSLHPSLSSSSVAPVHLSHPTNDCSVALGPPCII